LETWDVFHGDRLEFKRSLSTAEVRAALARGALRDDDLIRPSGTSIPWSRLADLPALLEPEPSPPPEPHGNALEPTIAAEPTIDESRAAAPTFVEDDDSEDMEVFAPDANEAQDLGEFDIDLDDRQSLLALPADEVPDENEWNEWDDDDYDPLDEDEAIAEFTLARNAPERVEELDLAAMVDVAFQLVLFFLVTASTILFKTLEVPKPNPESRQEGVAQGRQRSLEDLKDVFILVEIDPSGAMKIDREPVAAEMPALVQRLRAARANTNRKSMLISADFHTPHHNVVLAYDAANEIGLGIALARPQPSAPPAQPAEVPKRAAG
jgi:biopolymer transport protein ExbD